MSVYFVQMADSYFFKIGHSTNPVKRLGMLQVGCPHELKIFGIIKNADIDVESFLHNKYKKRKVRGEWFEFHPDEVDEILKRHWSDDVFDLAIPATNDFLAVIEKTLNLTSWGFHAKHLDQQEFDEKRNVLLNSFDKFVQCCQWLSMCHKTKKLNEWHTSYGYKHQVERYFNIYIPQGVFIAAIIHAKFRYKREGKLKYNIRVAMNVPPSIVIQRRDSRYLPGGKTLKTDNKKD